MAGSVEFCGLNPSSQLAAEASLDVLARYGVGRSLVVPSYDGSLESDGEMLRLAVLPAIRVLPGKRTLEADSPRHVAELARRDIEQRFPSASDALSDRLFLAQRDLVLNLRRRYGVDLPAPSSLGSVVASGNLSVLFDRQNGRCLVCGLSLDTVREGQFHLDHVIPTSLGGGDPADRSNWRLLCDACNEGRGNFVSAYLVPDFWGVPTGQATHLADGVTDRFPSRVGRLHAVSRRIRFAIFAINSSCQWMDCDVTPLVDKMLVAVRDLPVGYSAGVYCSVHAYAARDTERQIVS